MIDKKGLKTKENGRLSSPTNESFLLQLLSFLRDHYDLREEFEKDVWDVKNIPGAKYTQNRSDYLLSFQEIPKPFRNLVKKYLKVRVVNVRKSTCKEDIMSLRLFLNFIHERYPYWQDLTELTRQDIEDYLAWYKSYTEGWKTAHKFYLNKLRLFFEYIQKAEYPEAPKKASVKLLFKEDIPKEPIKNKEDIKYIPLTVLFQLDENIENIRPEEYIPVVIILRASGWRISDVLNLRYDKCLEKTSSGWWLKGDIPKVNILNHKVPIDDKVAALIKTQIEFMKKNSSDENNPEKYLFTRFTGKRKGKPLLSPDVQNALNRLAKKYNITDDMGNIFHFNTHAFRHSKGVELINNGMTQPQVQKWLGHLSPQMTGVYAKILDETLRKSWEEAMKKGAFKIDSTGEPVRVDISELENEDDIEWEYIRYNLDAVRLPLGYCLKPSKVECKQQLNPCLNCQNLCTTPDFIPQYENEVREIKQLIEEGKRQGRNLWVEKNQALLEQYERILATLKEGQIHHKAGKKRREYVGKERQDDPQA